MKANAFGFLPRNRFRDMAKEAYHFFLTHGAIGESYTIDGIAYTLTINIELNAVFIDWRAPSGEDKATSFDIKKSWN